MAKQELSQEEVWDDSALVNSWNEALEEYKKYHSLAVKGEKIELVLDKAESEPLYDIKTQAVESKQSQKDQVQPAFVNGDAGHAPAQAVGGVGAPQLQATAGTGVMPQALLNTGKTSRPSE